MDIEEKKERLDKKEDIKKIIDTSTDYKDLYTKSLKVLQKMEAAFQDSLEDIAEEKKWSEEKKTNIYYSIFDNELDTDNPVTIFEQKGAEILNKLHDKVEETGVINAGIQLAESIGDLELDQISKDRTVDELFQTRLNAIQNFEDDISDGILSNENNVDFISATYIGMTLGDDLFKKHNNYSQTTFEKYIDALPLQKLIFGTFNIKDGSGAFEDCLRKVKQKLGNQNLFDYIDSQEKGDQTSEILKYASLRMLLKRKKTSDLIDWIKGYKGDQQDLLEYIEIETLYNTDFTTCFLSSIDNLEKNTDFDGFFVNLVKNVKEDPMVQQAYENASKVDNADVFNSGVINALAIYDDYTDGGGGSYFDSDLNLYQNNRGFSIKERIKNSNYIKYVLKKGEDTITLVQLKSKMRDGDDCAHLYEEDVQDSLPEITRGIDYNLFALRGHCYNTDKMAFTLGWLDAVQENDILIDGGCGNAGLTGEYYGAGIKGQIFAYNGTGKGKSTQSFIDKIFDNKSDPQGYRKILDYYNSYDTEFGVDGHFAYYVERPDSVVSQYKKLLAYEWSKEYENFGDFDDEDEENITQESWN